MYIKSLYIFLSNYCTFNWKYKSCYVFNIWLNIINRNIATLVIHITTTYKYYIVVLWYVMVSNIYFNYYSCNYCKTSSYYYYAKIIWGLGGDRIPPLNNRCQVNLIPNHNDNIPMMWLSTCTTAIYSNIHQNIRDIIRTSSKISSIKSNNSICYTYFLVKSISTKNYHFTKLWNWSKTFEGTSVTTP